MYIRNILIFLAGFLQVSIVFSQPSQSWVQYRRGKSFLFDSSYVSAMHEFLPVMNDSVKSRSILPNSYYYYAYCAYKNNELNNANYILQNLQEDYPDWKNMDMVRYLRGVVLLKSGVYEAGLNLLEQCKSERFQQDIRNAKMHYLSRAPVDTLELLRNKFPDERIFNKFLSAKTRINDFKVAVLLPFGNYSSKKRLFYNLYRGIQMGAEKLKGKQIRIKLYPFDSGHDTSNIHQLFTRKGFTNFDLIIGPLYSEQFKIAAEYCKKHKTSIINPLLSDSSLVDSNKFAYLLKPTYKTRGIKTAQFCHEKFEGKNSAVIYLNSSRDSAVANAYKKQYEKLGGKVRLMSAFNRKTSSAIYDSLGKISLDSLSHVFAIGDEQSLATNLFSYIESELIEETRRYGRQTDDEEDEKEDEEEKDEDKLKVGDIPVVVDEHWLSFSAVTYDQFKMHNTHFMIPDYIRKNNAEAKKFASRFQDKLNLPPTNEAYMGYDMIYFLGQVMHKYSNYFYTNLKALPKTDGLFLCGFDYQHGNDNQFVPIVKFEENQLKVINDFEGEGLKKLNSNKQ